ncbi:MAG TPA: phosphoribosylglycinamide formyltransferase [Chakrabartia sp.]|jgi:formyltetrahydrofolate-dependent phosphoribosylglycinamide formyltransferase|nr:phosphoribosylglycinamide formyltransferase [Chakrabartia sp.]
MAKAKIAVLISGTGSNMAALVYAAKHPACPFEIVLVASNNPDAPGLKLAEGEGIPTFAHPHKGMTRADHDALMDAAIRTSGADYVALAGYMRILSPGFVQGWAGRMLNIHPSLLPQYKGLHTHERALEAGDSHGGVTVHLVTEELDDGEILGQTPVAILPGDTADSLAARVLIAEHQLYSRVLGDYVGRNFDPVWLTEQVRALAMAEAEAEESLSHGMACFGIKGGKKFAWVSDNHHGDGRVALLVKISGPDEQAMLIERDGDRYFKPAYFGHDWIAIRLDLSGLDWDDVAQRITASWLAVAPAKLKKALSVADAF